MENQAATVRRRMNMITGHFAGDDFQTGAAHVLLPLNCSSSLNSVIRCDNRMYFARQGSSYQPPFMRQQQQNHQPSTTPKATSSAKNIPNLIESPLFSRPTLKCPPSESSSSSSSQPIFYSTTTLISKQEADKKLPRVQPIVQDCSPVCQRPSFARPTKWLGFPDKLTFTINNNNNINHKQEESNHRWSPRMDVVEHKSAYILALELPGIGIKDIRVEVDDHNLTIKGIPKSLTFSWKTVNSTIDTLTTYHKREIFHGPYQVIWPFPANANKEAVSAEYIDGILHITVPKI